MVAIYARQSIEKKDSISIESQIDFCRKKLLQGEEFTIYTDSGYSGKNTLRPQFSSMINDIKNGNITKVMVYKVDRISRAIVDFSNMMELFNEYKVEFVSATQPIDTTNPMGKAMLSVVMIFAQLERETIQQRIKDNYYERGSKGYYLGGIAPFGFDKIQIYYKWKKTYTFSENEESKILLMLYEKYADSNMSLGELICTLEDSGKKDKRWSTATLGRTLRNPVYVKADTDVYLYLKNKGAVMNNDVTEYNGQNGCYLYGERGTACKFTNLTGKFVTLGLHKGIVPAGIWLKCQRKLDKNRQIKNSGKGTHSWLSGIIKCGYCGYAINVVNNNSGTGYITCGGRKLKICKERKRITNISDIEYCVEIILLEAIERLGQIEIFEKTNENSNEIIKLKSEQIKISETIKKLVNMLGESEEVTIEYLNKRITELDEQSKDIEAEIIKQSYLQKTKLCFNICDIINMWKDFSISQKKILAQIFIKKVTVTDDEIIIDSY